MGLWSTIKRKLGGNGEAFFTPAIKDGRTVARRFVMTVIVTELADSVALDQAGKRDAALAMRERSLDHLVALGLGPHDLESAEQRLVRGLRDGGVEPNAMIAAMWRLEGAGVLAWALGLRPAILAVAERAELADLRALCPDDAAGLEQLCAAAKLRGLGELMAARHEWSMRWFPVEHTPASEERSRILERIRALRWLTEADQQALCATPVLER